MPSGSLLTPRFLRTSTAPRLHRLSQPVDTNLTRDPVRTLDISPYQNTSLHHHDQDVVRELSLPPDSVSASATTRSRFYQSNGFPTQPQLDGPPSIYLSSPLAQHVSLDTFPPPPRTPSVPATQPSFFAHHGLPASLPPPPRTTFYTSTHIPPPEPVPEADNIVSLFDSLLRGSYSQMLSKNSDSESRVPAPEPPRAGESLCVVPHCTASLDVCPPAPRMRCCALPRLGEPELSLDDMLRSDYLDSNTFEEFLTSPLIQDDSPEETPFLETPGEEAWTSPMVDEADDSFGCGEMPLFGAAVRRQEETTDVKPPESLDIMGLLRLYTPQEPTSPTSFDASKIESVTPALDSLDSPTMYSLPQTPAILPTTLYNSPRLPATLLPPTSSSSASSSTVTASTSKQSRPTKPLPTGTRRNITPAALVPLDAPTQPRQYVTPSATSRKVVPAAFAKGKKRARSEVDGGGGDDADLSTLPEGIADLDPNTQDAIEVKRRQNTLAARRSRQRKLEHVRELEDTVERITQDRDMWMSRAYNAEEKLRVNGIA